MGSGRTVAVVALVVAACVAAWMAWSALRNLLRQNLDNVWIVYVGVGGFWTMVAAVTLWLAVRLRRSR